MDSNYIKTMILSKFRYANQVSFIATEVDYADVLLISKNEELIEIEVKISKSDLFRDFKKTKHIIYNTSQSSSTPRKFYYCVPANLVDDAITLTKNTSYGVMECLKWKGKDYRSSSDRILTRKRAKKLHNYNVCESVKYTIASRMASELVNHKLKLLLNN